MQTTVLKQYLYEHIPLSHAMQVGVSSVEKDSITLSAPLLANINHTNTVFGGSISAVATLSAWSLIYMYMKNIGINSTIVIQRNSMEFLKPIHGSFTASSRFTHPEELSLFLKTLSRRGRARVSISSILKFEENVVGKFEGDFVVTREFTM